jgi:hypothetical protein
VLVQFNQIGGTTAEVLLTGNGASTAPYEPGVWFNDAVPTIHVGFTDDLIPASETTKPADGNCEYTESHLTFTDLDHYAWNFGTPQDSGAAYYTAGQTDATGATWFRPVFLHELLHAFGLAHSPNTYAFMNYYEMPWANRSGADAVRPLPDDVRGLRYLYPAGGSRTEVAMLNTWFRREPSGPANQYLNCAPSLGLSDSTPFNSDLCGTGGVDSGETEVCSGDILRTRFTVANYSTAEVDLTVRMYLSPDDRWDPTDTMSVTSRPVSVPAAHSDHFPRSWVVPTPPTRDADYHVIVRVTGSTTAGVPVAADWIPLTGTVHVKPAGLC